MALKVRNLNAIRAGSATPEMLAQALQDIIDGHNSIASQLNADSEGPVAAPTKPNSLTVTAQGGVFHGSIVHNGPFYRGITYHVDAAADAGFSNPFKVHQGPSRDFRVALGNQPLFFRAYTDYPTSGPSDAVYHGGAQPVAVQGGGTWAGPAIPPAQGSGTGGPARSAATGPFRSVHSMGFRRSGNDVAAIARKRYSALA